MKRIIIIGSGFAGLWAAISAARKRETLNESDLEILVISQNPYHDIRPRFYEEDLEPARILLTQLLDPINVKHVCETVEGINVEQKTVGTETTVHHYDRLVLAAGSQLAMGDINGLAKHSFNVDTFGAGKKLEKHLHQLPQSKETKGRYTAVVVGGGFTGLEIVSELPERLKRIAEEAQDKPHVHVYLIDHTDIASSLGEKPKPTILQALNDMHISTIENTSLESITSTEAILSTGECIATQTVIWTVGMKASPLTNFFPVERDRQNRMLVDTYLQVPDVEDCFCAGDTACAYVDDDHTSVMSYQHALPQGKIVGHNVVADLYGKPMLAYRQEKYVTCLDLGSWGALYMNDWDRHVVSERDEAKAMKIEINQNRIYPPLTGNAEDLFLAAEP